MARSISAGIQKEGELPFRKALVPARKYLLKRVGSILPYLLISSIIAMIVRIASGEWSPAETLQSFVMLPSEMLLLQNYGFLTKSFTGVVWYLSASYFAMALLYPVMRCWYDGYNRYFAFIVALLFAGLIQRNYGNLGKPNELFLQVFNTGFLRSVAMVSLGGFVYEMSVKLGQISFSKSGLRLLTSLEIVLYAGVFAYMTFHKAEYAKADSLIVLYLALAVAITLSGKSYVYGKMDCKPVLFMGKFSMVLFLNHYYWLLAARTVYGDLSVATQFGAMGISILTSLLVYALGRRLPSTGKKLLKRLVAEDSTNNSRLKMR